MKFSQYLPLILAVLYYVFTIFKGLKKAVPAKVILPNKRPVLEKVKNTIHEPKPIFKSSVIDKPFEMKAASMVKEPLDLGITETLYPKTISNYNNPSKFQFKDMKEVRKAIIMKEILDRKYF